MKYEDINFTIEDGQTIVNYTLVNNDGTRILSKEPYYIDGELNEKALSILSEAKKQERVLVKRGISDLAEKVESKDLSNERESNVIDADYVDVTDENKTKVNLFKKLNKKTVLVGLAGIVIGVGLAIGARSCAAKQLVVTTDTDTKPYEQNLDELEKVTYMTYDQFVSAVNYTKEEINTHGTSEIEDSEIAAYIFMANVERMDKETQERIISEGLIADTAENVLQDSYQTIDAINSITINATYGGSGHYFDYTKIFVDEKDKQIASWYLENLKNSRGENGKKIVDSYYAMLNNDKTNTDAPFVNNEINAGVYYILNSSAGVMTLEGATSVGTVDYAVYDNFEQKTDMFETSNALQTLQANCFGTKTK